VLAADLPDRAMGTAGSTLVSHRPTGSGHGRAGGASRLIASGLSLRDVVALLGISPQRVFQLTVPAS